MCTKDNIVTFGESFFKELSLSLSFVSFTILVFKLQVHKIDTAIFAYVAITGLFIRLFIWLKENSLDSKQRNLLVHFLSAIFITTLAVLAITSSGTLKAFIIDPITRNILIIIDALAGFIVLFDQKERSSSQGEICVETTSDTELSKHARSWHTPALYSVLALFIAIKIATPILFKGSFIDEYFHVFSGIELFKTGHFAEIYKGELYNRGFYISFLVGLYTKVFGETFFVTKMVPASIGLISFSLLYLIARRLIINKTYNVFLMLAYTISPWVIFNHFYIRIYSFYEMVVLLITYLLVRNKIVLAIITTAVFIYMDELGSMSQIASLYVLICLYLKIELWKFWKSNLISIGIIVLFLHQQIFAFLNGFFTSYLYYSTPDTVKYGTTVLGWGAVPIVLLVVFFLFQINIKNKNIWLNSIPVILLVHLISPKSVQVNRAILYVYPIIYLCVFIIISQITKKTRIVLTSLLFISIGLMFPHFLVQKTLGLPEEIAYIDTNVFLDAKRVCKGKNIMTSTRPGIAAFYDINPAYYINSKFSDPSWVEANNNSGENRLFYKIDDVLYDTYTHVQIIADYSSLTEKLTPSDCIIMGGLPYSWVNDEMRRYILQNYYENALYKTNFESSRMHLYIERK